MFWVRTAHCSRGPLPRLPSPSSTLLTNCHRCPLTPLSSKYTIPIVSITYEVFLVSIRDLHPSKATSDALRSYFDVIDNRCLQITPAFFNASVLDKYLCNPEQYEVKERRIYSKDAWSLETYDINEAGQVHTYLIYLGQLPRREQEYWKTFNEQPRGGISERAFKTDIESDYGPDTASNRLKRLGERQERKNSAWWKTRDREALERYIPCTNGNAVNLWSESIGNLYKVTVENLVTEYFMAEGPHAERRKPTTIQVLSKWVNTIGIKEEERGKIVGPLKELAHLRNNVQAHGRRPDVAKKLLMEARKFPLRLRGHSLDLTARVVESVTTLEKVIEEKGS